MKHRQPPRPFTIRSKWISDELFIYSLKSEFYSNIEFKETMCNITGNSLGTIFSLDQNNQNMKNSKLVFFQERAVEFNNTMLIGGIYENEEKVKSHKYGKELQ